jgi:hypothetical protein
MVIVIFVNDVALFSPADWTIQFGEHLTITGFTGAAIMLALFALGPFLSGFWSVRGVSA